MKETKCLLVDKYPVFRQGISNVLEKNFPEFKIVGEASSVDEAIACVQKLKPDIIIMDIMMQGDNGVKAAITIHDMLPEAGLIAFSLPESENNILDAIRAGVSAYILKSATVSSIVESIQCVVNGGVSLSPALLNKLVREVRRDNAPSDLLQMQELTAREKDILGLAALGASNKEIAEKYFISITTVKTHFQNILAKLDVKNRTGAVAVANSNGLLRKAPAGLQLDDDSASREEEQHIYRNDQLGSRNGDRQKARLNRTAVAV